jgi:hypothetical protein
MIKIMPCTTGGVPSLSSSSSQGSMTLDDPSISRPPVCLARVLVDYVPSPYDKEALRLKVSFFSLICSVYCNVLFHFWYDLDVNVGNSHSLYELTTNGVLSS